VAYSENNSPPKPGAVVVNDDTTQLNVLCGLLQKAGLEPVPFKSAETALVAMGRDDLAPVLIVTDLYMPGIDGWQFCRLLRSPEFARFNKTPILVVSATFSGDEPARITTDLGANAFLRMPFIGQQFVEQVRSLLKGETTAVVLKVLMVEAGGLVSTRLLEALQAHGYWVDAASSYQEALAMIAQNTYDVVVLDYHLPDGAGDGLLRPLQENSPDCVCIMMTADPQPELALTWMKLGVSAYLQKPFEPEYLIAQCERARRERALLRVQDLLQARTRQLGESELYLRTILQTTQDGFWVLNADGKFIDANHAYCEMTGYTLTELTQLGINDLDALEDPAETTARIKRVIEFGAEQFDTRHRRKDGSVFDVEVSTTYWRNDGGRFICLCRDITERKQAEDALRKSEASLAESQRIAQIGSWEWDLIRNIVVWSKEMYRVYDIIPGTFDGKPESLLKIIHPDDVEKFTNSMRINISSGKSPSLEYRVIHKDGSIHTIFAMGNRKLDGQGKAIKIIGTAQDITELKRTEELLRESEEKYKFLHESAGVGIGYYSPDGIVISYNLMAARNMGGHPEDFTGKSIYELFPTRDAEVYMDRIRKAAASNEMHEYEDKVELPGSFKWFTSVFTRILNSSNQVIGVQIISSDISKNKEVEEALKKERRRLDNIIKGTNTGTWEWNIQTGETIFNDRWAEIIGYTLEEMSPVSIETWMKYAHPDDLKASNELIERNFRRELDYYEFESRMKHKDGSWVWVLDRGKVTSWTDDGKPWVMMGTHQDITKRKRAEETLRDSEAQKHAILNGITANIALVDKELKILWANKAAAGSVNMLLEDMTGRSCFSFWGDSVRPCANCPALRAFQTGQSEHIIVQTPDGRIWDERGEPVRDAGGNVVAVVEIAEDITERKNAEHDLQAAYTKLEALWSITTLQEADPKAISDHILMTITRMTGSDYGFYGFVNEEESAMNIHSWSGEAMKDCSIEVNPQHFPVSTAGIWAEAIRRREPFILNDYNLEQSAKKGLPAGHVSLRNLLVVPHLVHNKIISVAAVANRQNDYTRDDVSQIITFLTSIEAIVASKRMEQELFESEEKFRLLVENQQDLLVKTDVDGHILYVNPVYCDLFDKTEKELIGSSYAPLVHPDDLPIVEKAVADLFKPPFECSYEERANTRHGMRWLSWAAKAIVDEQGRVTALIGSGRDITERKQAEVKLRESEEKYRLRVEYSSDLIWNLDAAGMFSYVSPSWEHVVGYHPSALIGTLFQAIVHPDDIPACLEYLQRMTNRSEFAPTPQYRVRHADGSWHWHEGVTTPVLGPENEFISVVGVSRDINERKLAEAAIHESEERYHLIDEASQDLIYSYDRQSRFTHANSSLCKMLGLAPEQILGKTHEELGFPNEQCIEWAHLHQKVYETNSTVISETVTPIQGGIPQHFEVVLNPIHDETGAIIGIAGTTRDINAKKMAEKKIDTQIEELRRWHNITLGREDRILELKREVNQLLLEAGKPLHYASVQEVKHE